MEQILALLPDTPIVAFTILLLVTLTIPPIFEKLRLPGLVGLLVAGVVLGPDGLGFLDPKSEMMKLLSDAGKIYLMFVAGMEIDLEEFRKKKNRSLAFGIATFLLPLIFGTLVGQMFGFGLNSSILIGSLIASHTLLGYPIVTRLGVATNEAVTVTIGATIFTDIAALLVLAICVSIHAGEFSPATLAIQLGALAIYSAIVLFGLDWAGKEYFRRTGDEESNQFLFVLLSVFLASVGAQIINVDKIVGAFLAGLAVNDVVGHGPVEEKVEFVGSTLFIPFFFVGMGLLLDIPAFMESITSGLPLTLAIVGGLLASKLLAALVAKLLFRYNWNEALTMWSLSLPQVAATLAAALAGFRVGLISEPVFNAVIVLMLVTSILGPVTTAQFASRLPLPKLVSDSRKETDIEPSNRSIWLESETSDQSQQQFTVVVPVYNPLTERYLIEMAALLARHESGAIVPLSIAKAHVHMDDPKLRGAIKQSNKLLDRAIAVSEEFQVKADPKIRIDHNIAQGICRTAREENANLIVMGSSETSSLRTRAFGNLIDSVFWASHCPVAVMRLLDEPINIHQVLMPVKSLTPRAVRTVRFAQLFADTNQAEITFLHVCDRRTPKEEALAFKPQLEAVLSEAMPQVKYQIKIVRHDDAAQVILKFAQSSEMVILRSIRRRTAGGLAVSNVTTRVIQGLTCSMVLFGEPHS
ncbi:MAG: cation:proton antiporter [Hormoscilla sp. SP5CHS1]|nr:cation:proton antiporter [Hormoscilla sp. SP12CHS1]MBC6453116.1 cation:proton antiporter [Hormoscilla sp. SP5CHS1]